MESGPLELMGFSQNRTMRDNRRPAVLMIVENLPVPLDRRVWQEARTLTEAGYRVSIISPKAGGLVASHETREGIEIYRHRIWEASGPLGYLLEYSCALAAEFLIALKIYARTRFRILQACNPPDTMFLIGLFFKIFGVRFIFDHHDLNPELFLAKFGRGGFFYKVTCAAERLTFLTAKVSMASNQSFREIALTRGGMREDRVFVVRSCPDLKKTGRGMERPQLKEGRQYLIVYVGVMGPQDGLDLLLQSIEFILTQRHELNALFALIGLGTELPRLKAEVTQKGLDSVVKFTGPLYGEPLNTYLATADICVAPDPANTVNDKLTMNKILEYMAQGRPVVLYDLTEGRRSAGEAGLYARPNDPIDFAEQILKLLDSESLRKQLGECGRKRIEQSLNWEIEKKALLQAYETALKV